MVTIAKWHDMTVLYPKPCYNEWRYKRTALYYVQNTCMSMTFNLWYWCQIKQFGGKNKDKKVMHVFVWMFVPVSNYGHVETVS